MTETQILIETVLQALAAGLFVGAIYGLMCAGLSLIFGIMRVINFAQGDFMMLGMYAVYFFLIVFGIQALVGNTVSPYIAVVAMAPLLYLFGWAIHRFLISQVTGIRTTGMEAEGHYAQLVLTLGIALVMHNGAMILFGPELVSVDTPLSSSAWVLGPLWGDGVLLFLNKARIVSAVISAAVVVGLWYVLKTSRLGKSLRAAADNPQASIYVGNDVDRSYRTAFALGTMITAMAGGLLTTNYPFHPFVGLEYVVLMYAGVVLGGIGSVIGAFWGGMTIGLIQQFSTIILPTQLQNATIFVIFLLIVILRPQGFFGRSVERT
ncbi:branched-chain amino acid ABC transporter permease [Fodinicurvata fenggangensis]|uniref:branched-chain amino acid ABC transporter permease n=1 Tax=Fodinicurvata fenggangensis TaxID=1121830 RepID=UPI000B176059|nr:branched-chain amino acid ABC transporter permease [Fodinicurvata fenggangensis]